MIKRKDTASWSLLDSASMEKLIVSPACGGSGDKLTWLTSAFPSAHVCHSNAETPHSNVHAKIRPIYAFITTQLQQLAVADSGLTTVGTLPNTTLMMRTNFAQQPIIRQFVCFLGRSNLYVCLVSNWIQTEFCSCNFTLSKYLLLKGNQDLTVPPHAFALH